MLRAAVCLSLIMLAGCASSKSKIADVPVIHIDPRKTHGIEVNYGETTEAQMIALFGAPTSTGQNADGSKVDSFAGPGAQGSNEPSAATMVCSFDQKGVVSDCQLQQ